MKIAIISDIHGNKSAFRSVLRDMEKYNIEIILFLGDICGYYPFVNECMELWIPEKMRCIRGNHDEVLVKCLQQNIPPNMDYRRHYGSALERSWQSLSEEYELMILSWPISLQLTLMETHITMYHGSPWNPLEGRVYPDFTEWSKFDEYSGDVILLGHTHYPFVKQWKNKLIINPGSVGQPRHKSGGSSYAQLDLNSGQVEHRWIVCDMQDIIQDALSHDREHTYLVEVLTR